MSGKEFCRDLWKRFLNFDRKFDSKIVNSIVGRFCGSFDRSR